MTRILQYLVWISVITASGRTQRSYSNSYQQNTHGIIFPDTRTYENYEYPRKGQTEQHLHSDLEDPRRQRIKNFRVSEQSRTENGFSSRIQLSKRGGHRKHNLTKLILELFAALGVLDAEASTVVFPGPSSKSRFEPEISDACRKLGYCKKIPNYPNEQIKQLLGTLGNDLRQRFQMDELDTNDVQIAQRFGAEGLSFGLCNSTEEIIVPDSLPDKDDKWWTVLQDRENNMTQGFRAENCRDRDSGCSSLVSFPPGYTHRCEQKYVFRSVLIVENNKAVAQKSLRVPSCCSCTITAPTF